MNSTLPAVSRCGSDRWNLSFERVGQRLSLLRCSRCSRFHLSNMCKKPLFLSCCICVLALNVLPLKAQTVKIKLEIILVDQNLNQKPVPWFHVRLRREDSRNPEAFELKTKRDGTCDTAIPAGRYELATPQPINLKGSLYTWSMEVMLSGAQARIELSNDNATVERAAPQREDLAKVSERENNLSLLFERLKKSTVTVRADEYEGSGFLVDPAGLVVTNNHVVE